MIHTEACMHKPRQTVLGSLYQSLSNFAKPADILGDRQLQCAASVPN